MNNMGVYAMFGIIALVLLCTIFLSNIQNMEYTKKASEICKEKFNGTSAVSYVNGGYGCYRDGVKIGDVMPGA